jgi:hypothetical protein
VVLGTGLVRELEEWWPRDVSVRESKWACLNQWSERWSSEDLPREVWGLHCRGYLEHPLGGPSSTHLEASSEQVLSRDLTEKPSLSGLPRETGGLHCRGHIEHPLGDPGSTLLEASSSRRVCQSLGWDVG